MARSNKNHDTTRETLIKIALELFLDHGYENTTVVQIMKAASLSKGGMYHYFASKEEILDAVIQFGLMQESERTRAVVAALPVEERLIAFAQGTDVGDFASKLLSYSSQHKDSIVAYKVREYNIHLVVPLLTEILEEGIAAGIYNVSYPKEVAEFCSLLVRAIADSNLLPATDLLGQQRRMETFFHIVFACVAPSKEHAAQLKNVFAGYMDINDSEQEAAAGQK